MDNITKGQRNPIIKAFSLGNWLGKDRGSVERKEGAVGYDLAKI